MCKIININNMCKEIYKINDKVYDHQFGWGKVTRIDNSNPIHPITVVFESGDNMTYMKDGRSHIIQTYPHLSFTEYNFIDGGFSQKRPKEIPKEGQLIYVKDYGIWNMRYFSHMENKKAVCYNDQQKRGLTTRWNEYSIENPLLEEE